MKAIYTINNEAKEYSEKAQKNYEANNGATARSNSLKKTALYQVKNKVLEQNLDFCDEIQIHTIESRLYFCLYFGSWSFHCPVDEIEIDRKPSKKRVVSKYDEKCNERYSDLSLKEALVYIKEKEGINANDYLPEKTVTYKGEKCSISWDYI